MSIAPTDVKQQQDKIYTSHIEAATDLKKRPDSPQDISVYVTQTGIEENIVARYEKDGKKIIIPMHLKNGRLVKGQPRRNGRTPYRADQIEANQDKKVLVVEGEKCAKCQSAQEIRKNGYEVTTWQGGANAVDRTDWSVLAHRKDVYIWPDKDEPGFKAAFEIKKQLPNAKVITPPRELPEKGDIADLDWTDADETIAFIESSDELIPEEENPKEVSTNQELVAGEQNSPTKAVRLYELAKPKIHLYYIDGEDKTYAEILIRDKKVLVEVRSARFKKFLSSTFYQETKSSVSSSVIEESITLMEGEAFIKAKSIDVSLRVGGDDKKIVHYLANEENQAVVITPGNIEILPADQSGCHFEKTNGMKALPIPDLDGDFNVLRDFTTFETIYDWYLYVGFLCQAFRKRGPYPILVLSGEHGSAKSTTAENGKNILDPSIAPRMSPPRNEQDAAIQARHYWLLSYDNVSSIPSWLSDFMCTLSTGGGFAVRSLYKNDELTILPYQRPLILNGITEFVTRPDALDRALIIHLPQIPDEKRMSEKEYKKKWEDAFPSILGGFYNLLAEALKHHPVEIDELPRMADFVSWGCAIEKAAGWPEESFLDAYRKNKEEGNQISLDASILGTAFMFVFDDYSFSEPWKGTASDLLEYINGKYQNDLAKKSKFWPTTPRKLSGDLRRIIPNLRNAGFDIQFGRSKERSIQITRNHDCYDGIDGSFSPLESKNKRERAYNVWNTEHRDMYYTDDTVMTDDDLANQLFPQEYKS